MSTPYPPSQPDDPSVPAQPPVEPQPPVYPQPTYTAPAAPPTAYPAPAAPAPTYGAPAAPPTAYPAPAYGQQAAYPQQAAYQQPGYGAPGAPQQPGTQTNTMAVVALIGAIVLAPLGIVLGLIALSQIKKTRQGGRGLALAGVIIGTLGTLIWVAVIAAIVVAANRVSDNVGSLDTLSNDITVQANVVTVSMWAESVKSQTGAYPTELSADAPSTGDVTVTLVPSGADLCVEGKLNSSTFHMIDYGSMLKGGC